MSKRIITTDFSMLETQKMANNVMCDVETSSAINKRVREGGTLVVGAN